MRKANVFAVAVASALMTLSPSQDAAAAQAVAKPAVLVLIDSVSVRESSAVQVNKVGDVGVSYTRTYIADPDEWRVLEVSRQGAITRTFGRRGQGPGEFEKPGSIAATFEELYVMDYSLRRVNVFSVASGKFVRSFPLNAFLPTLTFHANELYAASFDEGRKTSVIRLSPTGNFLGYEGVIPEIGRRLPMLLQPFPHQAVAVSPWTVYMVSELANSLYSWPKNGGVVTELAIPVRARRGANPEKFEQMVRDPQKAGAIAYDHSLPVAMAMLGNDSLVLATYDPVYKQGKFSGQYHVSVLDVAARRACVDVPIPVSAEPLARVALPGSRITVVQQVVVGGDAVTTIRRYRINPSACKWVPMK